MVFAEVLKKRRSIRKYLDKDVPLEIIKEIINDSIMAPSSSNEQTWKFVIVNNRDIIKKISVESKSNLLARIEKNPEDHIKKYEGLLRNETFNVFYNAPSLVIILGPKNYRNLYINCSLAACYFMMSAASRGLGTCWIKMGSVIEDSELLKELGIGDDMEIIAPIILGYPENIPSPPKRNKPDIVKIIE